jgi:hypothetical protein
LFLYIQQNPDVYSYDYDKVQFALGFFTEGLPSEWAFMFIEKVAIKNKEKKPEPWGTWTEFYDELEAIFGDPNEKRNELTKLENLTMKTGQTAAEFFQEFDLYAIRAEYMGNDKILIRMAEKKIPKQLIRSLYNHGTPPIVYQDWKNAIIVADNIEREFREATSQHTTTASSSKDAATPSARNKTRSKSKSKGQDKKKTAPFFFYPRKSAQTNAQQTGSTPQKPEGKCFLCGKEGHWKKDCPNQKKIVQLRAQISDLTKAELDFLNESSF